ATIVGSGLKASPRFAAWTNGTSIHADDFDDTQLSAAKDRVYGLLVHPTVPVLPAIFALAEGKGVSGKEFMLAYHLGVEVECKIAEAISPRHYQDGFHSTGTCGPSGSEAASAILSRRRTSWTFASPGVSLKPYPSGSLTHPAMTELACLIAANNIQAAQVEKLDVGGNHNMTTTLLHHQPKTGFEAKFSIESC